MPWIKQCPLYIGPILGDFILNKLVCKFDIIENGLFLYKYIWVVIIDISTIVIIDLYYYPYVLDCFISISTSHIGFKLTMYLKIVP